MRTIIWSPKASRDLFEQLAYIGIDSPVNASLVRDRVMASVARLSDLQTGCAGRVFGTYEIVVPKTSLILAYDLPKTDDVRILRLIHGARNWLPGKWPKD